MKLSMEEKNTKFLEMVKMVVLDNFRDMQEEDVNLHLRDCKKNKIVQIRIKNVVVIWEKCGSNLYISYCNENNEKHCKIKRDFMNCSFDLRSGIDRVYKYIF